MAKKIYMSQDDIDELVQKYRSGTSLRELSREYPQGRNTLAALIKGAGVSIRDNMENSRKYHHDENYFEKIDTQEKAYWLGFIYADGFIESKRVGLGNQKFGITLSSCDIDHVDKFKQCIKATNPIKTYSGSGYNVSGQYSRILLTSQKTVEDLKRAGVVEQKTLKLDFPSEDIVPKNLQRHFVRGYFDGDGSLSYWTRKGKSKDTRSYLLGFTGTYDFLRGINSFFEKDLAIRPSHNAYQINFGGNVQLKSFLSTLYEDASVYLDRKHDVYEGYLKYVER
jgi:hypothetical protein